MRKSIKFSKRKLYALLKITIKSSSRATQLYGRRRFDLIKILKTHHLRAPAKFGLVTRKYAHTSRST